MRKIWAIYNEDAEARALMSDTTATKSGLRALLADDDPILRELGYSSLRSNCFSVDQACDGAEAISLIERNSYDVVVTDLSMPSADGFDVLAHVRGHKVNRHIPVIVITCNDDFASIERAYAAGATSFVAKPINWTMFHHHLRFVMRAHEQEGELRKARQIAEKASKFKSNLLTVLSHELRTPLHQLLGFSDIFVHERAGALGSQDYRDFAAHIGQAAHVLDSIVSDMMVLSKAVSQELRLGEEETGMGELVGAVVETARSHAPEREFSTDLNLPGGDVELICDRKLISRALGHLVDNAVKFSPEGSRVDLSVDLCRTGSLIMAVTDRGPGIDKKKVAEYVKPFSQCDMSRSRAKGGIGIGLSICNLVARAHGGNLLIVPARGGGTIAGLTFPAKRVVSSAESRATRSEQETGPCVSPAHPQRIVVQAH